MLFKNRVKTLICWKWWFRQRVKDGDFESQAQYAHWFSEQSGGKVSTRTIERWFDGSRSPSPENRVLICDVHCITGRDRDIIIAG